MSIVLLYAVVVVVVVVAVVVVVNVKLKTQKHKYRSKFRKKIMGLFFNKKNTHKLGVPVDCPRLLLWRGKG